VYAEDRGYNLAETLSIKFNTLYRANAAEFQLKFKRMKLDQPYINSVIDSLAFLFGVDKD